MKRHILYGIVAICLLFTTNAFAAITWDGTAAAWTKGSGTEADPYLIETPKNLAYLLKTTGLPSGQYYRQTQDFDMGNRSLPTSAIFSGTYDGNSKTITNAKSAIFNSLNDAMVMNLTCTTPVALKASGNVSIINCHNIASVMPTNIYYTSETLRYSSGGSYVLQPIGGIICYSTCEHIYIDRCSNHMPLEGNITGGGSNYSTAYRKFAGGMIGWADGASANSDITILNTMNYGSIKYLFSSGFIGSVEVTNNKTKPKIKIIRCGNESEIDHTSSPSYTYYTFCTETIDSLMCSYSISPISSSEYHVPIVKARYVRCCYFRETDISSDFAEECYLAFENNVTHDVYDAPHGINNYYSNSISWKTVYYYGGSTLKTYFVSPLGWTAESKSMMKSKKIVDELNFYADEEVFAMDNLGINDGYPILKWQLEGMTFYKLRATCQEGQGTVSGSGEYPENANITIKATPKDGFVFTGWSDGNTDNPRAVTVTGDATYVAQFSQSAYTIYVNQDCTTSVE